MIHGIYSSSSDLEDVALSSAVKLKGQPQYFAEVESESIPWVAVKPERPNDAMQAVN